LGILAHVDAGKTTLTERLLYAAGVIDEPGRVDDGSTQTDTLALEQQRGITIKTAVVSFAIDDVTVNLIDTPGHPDFIAEVERVLSVLDGAVLVISAVEGVQPQTRVLMRALQRLRVPTLLFVNKLDRLGADGERTLQAVRERLTPAVVALGSTHEPGTRAARFALYGEGDAGFTGALADLLSTKDDSLLAAYVDGHAVPYADLRGRLAAQTKRALVHPVLFGSALTGAGVEELAAAIAELLPATEGDADGPVSGTVFKVERGAAGEKIAYVRLFSGTIRTRDRLDDDGKVTAISVFERGPATPGSSVTGGQIAKLWGLGAVRIGDAVGASRAGSNSHHFAPPTLETVVYPCRAEDKGRLHVALTQLAEQDPLINLRQDDVRQELFLSLYGEVQKEVIQQTLADDFGVEAGFRETTTICVERPVGTGEAVERIRKGGNPFIATVGLRVEPGPAAGGVEYRRDGTVLGTMPRAFFTAVEETVHEALRQGLQGWQVIDCTVTLIRTGYYPRQSHAHQGFAKEMSSTAGDFRNLTPLVLMTALKEAGTKVCQPIHRFHLELPADALGPVLPVIARMHGVPETPAISGSWCSLEGEIPAAEVHELRKRLPALTRGEGVLESAFDSYREVIGEPPVRPRTDHNPLDREDYLLRVAQRVSV
jgi:ribosomal protection tetracycline resistance protein